MIYQSSCVFIEEHWIFVRDSKQIHPFVYCVKNYKY